MKTLIYYFYVHKTGWNPLYNLHFFFLSRYRERFDSQNFILAIDEDTPKENVERVKKAILEIFPSAQITYYPNDPELRESNYFYNEIASNLTQLPDQWYFFAHNKGVDTWYASPELCRGWISGMYFMNLNYMDEIEKQLSYPEMCVIGTFLIRNVKAWKWLRYNWHFSGTFWWFNPRHIYKVMIKHNTSIPENSRYFTEGVWGTTIPDNERYRQPALGMYEANWRYCFQWMTPKMRLDLENLSHQN